MADSLSQGFAFALNDIWRPSIFQTERDDGLLFQALDADLPELESQGNDLYQKALQIPQLGEPNGLGEQELESLNSEVASVFTEPLAAELNVQDALQDVWTLNIDDPPRVDLPRLRTWEAFEKKEAFNTERSVYLSEAGPEAFDLALAESDHDEPGRGVLPQRVIFRAFHNLVSGRSSVFFQWNAAKKCFAPTLENVPISGYSLPCCRSFTDMMVGFGSTHRTLKEYASGPISLKRSCTAMIAFKGCLTSILDGIDEHVTNGLLVVHSLLQLQRLTELPRQVLSLLRKLYHSVQDCVTDEDLISCLSDQIHCMVGTQGRFSKLFQIVLARVSAPWLERLCGDIGLSESYTNHTIDPADHAQSENGADMNVSPLKPNSKDNHFPKFVSEDDQKLISGTKAGLQVLRKHVPDADLLLARAYGLQERIWDGAYSSARPYYVSTNELDGIHDEDMKSQSSLFGDNPSPEDGSTEVMHSTEGAAWADDEARHDYLSTMDARISGPLQAGTQYSDRLRLATTSSLEQTPHTTTEQGFEHWRDLDVNPLDRLRPLIQAHGRIINRVLLQHLFRGCHLPDHLNLQRQYHLLGNGNFVARLSKALFSAETQSAERRRGTVPTSETMGLRLGTRRDHRWPPASSELRLTLAGVLTETYYPQTKNRSKPSDTKELPGGLSFSIRELADKDIERVLDSGSIYALDFIRLQYAPPSPLDAVLTPASMQEYDGAFKFLLRVLRVLHVTTRLREQAISHNGERDRSRNRYNSRDIRGVQFALQAHHLVSVLMSHIMDLGIAAPWQRMMLSLSAIEKTLDVPYEKNNIIGLDGLRQLHETCLETMRNRLFLRRKQDKIRIAIENLLTHILVSASSMEKEKSDESEHSITTFKSSVSVLLDLLQAGIDKPAKTTALANSAEGDVEATKILLTRLRWSSFYDDAA